MKSKLVWIVLAIGFLSYSCGKADANDSETCDMFNDDHEGSYEWVIHGVVFLIIVCDLVFTHQIPRFLTGKKSEIVPHVSKAAVFTVCQHSSVSPLNLTARLVWILSTQAKLTSALQMVCDCSDVFYLFFFNLSVVNSVTLTSTI